MEKSISSELEGKLQTTFKDAYYQYFQNNEQAAALANQVSTKLGLFYMGLALDTHFQDIRVVHFKEAEQSFIGYLLWSKDLQVYGAQKSRFFLVLSEFGVISGIEISAAEELKYNLWVDLLAEKKKAQILERMEKFNEEVAFSKENVFFQQYRKILADLPEEFYVK